MQEDRTKNEPKKRALFLDRDGVINKDTGYVHTQDEFIPLDENLKKIEEIIKKEHFDIVIVVTNQAGIARGYYTEEEFLEFQAWVETFLRGRGIPVERTYHCPHHPSEGIVAEYSKMCECRKPEAGMLLKAAEDYNIDIKESLFIGDKDSDMEAGKAAGCKVMKV